MPSIFGVNGELEVGNPPAVTNTDVFAVLLYAKETEKPKETIPNQEVPFLPTSNPMTEMYRRYSMSEFDIAITK